MNVQMLMARRQRGLTQQQLAAKAKVNSADMVRIERHEWIPPSGVRRRIARALGATEEALFGELIAAAR